MKLMYVSRVCEDNFFEELFDKGVIKSGRQIQKHHSLIIEGLKMNETIVKVISAPPVSNYKISFTYPKRSRRSELQNVSFHYIKQYSNIMIRYFWNFLRTFIYVLYYSLFNRTTILVDSLVISQSLAASLAGRLSFSNVVCFVSDRPEDMFHNNYFFKGISRFIISISTHYVFVTKQANEFYNKKNKPYEIIESQADIKLLNQVIRKSNKNFSKKIMYAGAVNKNNGIDKLLEAFEIINDNQYELHIYGNGILLEELLYQYKSNENIYFYGSKPNEFILKKETEVDLLINPRPSNQEFTKYSFPIKIMEYMSSGTPVLTTALSGIPKEYFEYLYIIDDETTIGLAKSIKEVFSKEENELVVFGNNCKQWIMNNKNNVIQAKRILNMINNWRKV